MAIVYAHYRKSDNEIFYIGIGRTIKRAYEKKEGRNRYWHSTVGKYGYKVEILCEDLSWEQACEVEVFLIAFYGRKNFNLGPLVNLTDGGEGGVNPTTEAIEKSHVNTRIPIIQYDMSGNFIREWPSMRSVKLELQLSDIGACCRNKCGYKSVGGFIWRYKDSTKWFPPIYVDETYSSYNIKKRRDNTDYSKGQSKRILKRVIAIIQYDINGVFIKNWNSAAEAGDHLKICKSTITKCCKGVPRIKSVKGYIFRYKDPIKWFPPIYKDNRLKRNNEL